MIHSTIAGGVYDDADHNTTQYSLVDLLEPAGSIPRSPVLYKPANVPVGISWRAYMEGYYPLANGACNTISKNLTSGYVRCVFLCTTNLGVKAIVTFEQETQSVHVVSQHTEQHCSLSTNSHCREYLRCGRRQGGVSASVHVLRS